MNSAPNPVERIARAMAVVPILMLAWTGCRTSLECPCAPPPPAECLDATRRASYGPSARCAEQGCLYDRHEERCPFACVAGECVETARLVAGGYMACVLPGSQPARCWGGDWDHPFAETGPEPDPLTSTPQAIPWLDDVAELALGSASGCYARHDGTVHCWGANRYGALGDGTTDSRERPSTVLGVSDAVGLAVGALHSCALRSSGAVRCWGFAGWGELGNGDVRPTTEATEVIGVADAVQVAAGDDHTCALHEDGEVSCWGFSGMGQIGQFSNVNWVFPTPQPVARLHGAAQLALGKSHSCALRSDGTVACWGDNEFDQLGLGLDARVHAVWTEPTTVPGIDAVTQLVAGGAHTCALRRDGTVWCWGQDGSGSSDLQPTRVYALSDITQLAAGADFTCALRSDSAVLCWGGNGSGQIGDGTTEDRATPVEAHWR